MSNKAKYKSIYGSTRLLRVEQYLAELIIKRRADKKGLRLPDKFWTIKDIQYKYWKNALASEIIHGSKIAKQYDSDCIIKAFNSYECQVILTLKNSKLDRIANDLQKKKDLAKQVREINPLEVVSPDEKPRQPIGRKNKLGKLK